MTRAAIKALEGVDEPEAAILRKEYSVVLQDESLRYLRPRIFGKLRMTAIAAERDTLMRLRRERAIGEDAYRDVEEELDWAEGNARRRGRALRPLDRDDACVQRRAQEAVDLRLVIHHQHVDVGRHAPPLMSTPS